MGAANKLYNGNIAETFWRTATDGGFVRNYGYKYDNLNRLKDATYQKSGQVTGMYNENLSYDKNGNIMNLSRYGDRDEQYLPIQIDNLQYGYATNSNKLMSVVDNSNNTSGFKDGITTGDDYMYDANGNMTVDKNKKITSIVYNHLNLPTKIVFPTGNIVYFYNASGQKAQKVVTENTTVTTTDYLGGYQYKNAVLQFFPTVEGYVKNTLVSGTNSYSYVFNYTDHLGNTRLSYTKDTTTGSLKILEENNYYPFGLKHNSYNVDNFQPDYKYKFNGKELQDELSLNLYDYGARNYDPVLGRWMNMDPLAETSRRFSPYTYALNNPVYFIDPDGMQARYNWEEHDKGNKGVYTDDKTKENVSFETALAQTNANEQGGSNEPPKTIFVNGFLMFGDLKSGKDYWSKEFRQGARKYLSKNTEGVLDKYINYDPSILSSAKGRFNSGYDYAMNNYFDLISGMDKNKDYFNFVSHSMGSAFSEGIAKYMIEMGWKVGTSVHINAFQAADIVSQKSYSFKDQTKTIDYQNTDDPVINNSVRSSPGYIQGASLIIRVQSGVKAYDFIHASPISTGANFWSKISSIINH